MVGRFVENVNGVIIGEIGFQGALYYNGTKQGGTIYGVSDDEIIEKGKTALQEIKNNLGESYQMIFPLKVWEIRIY